MAILNSQEVLVTISVVLPLLQGVYEKSMILISLARTASIDDLVVFGDKLKECCAEIEQIEKQKDGLLTVMYELYKVNTRGSANLYYKDFHKTLDRLSLAQRNLYTKVGLERIKELILEINDSSLFLKCELEAIS